MANLIWDRASDTEWQAHDGAYCYSIVEEFVPAGVKYDVAVVHSGKITPLGWSLNFAMARALASDYRRAR